MPRGRNPDRERAFSLVELLAVITLLAILCILAVPMLGRARDKQSAVRCTNNLRQIGAALFGYAADHNMSLPAVSSVWPPANAKSTWGYAIWTYAGYQKDSFSSPGNDLGVQSGAVKPNVFRCPATWRTATNVPSASKPNSNLYSYGLNCRPRDGRPSKGDTATDWTSPILLSSVRKLSAAAMVTECSFCLGTLEGYFTWFGLIPHLKSSNVLFYDGHVEWRSLDDIPKSDKDAAGQAFWNGS